jgi:hypothetical protein
MTNNNYPITPPPELVNQWLTEGHHQDYCSATEHAIAQAARWGSDQELEACCELLVADHWETLSRGLRTARRTKPPSLKEQALEQLDSLHSDLKVHGLGTNTDTIRRALEQLDD